MKIRLFMVAAMLGLLAAACTKDQQQDNTTVKTPISIKANYGNNGSKVNYTESGNTISATWQSGDKLLVVYNNNVNTLDLVDGVGENSATFSGTITGSPSEGAMLVCYVKDQNTPNGTITVNGDGSYIYTSDAFLGQDGTLASAAKLNLYCGWTRYSSTSDINCSVGVNTSMMKFTVSGISDDAGSTATITYKSGATEVSKATFSVAAGDNTIYLAIPAGHYMGEQNITYTCGGIVEGYCLSATHANFRAGETYSKSVTYMSHAPLTFEAKTAGSTVSFGGGNNTINLEYKINDGSWSSYSRGTVITLTSAGNKVSFRGDNTTINNESSSSVDKFTCSGQCFIYGNIMSLLSSTSYATATTLSVDYTFWELFKNNSALYNHSSKKLLLPATTLSDACYFSMFFNCTNLTATPDLPATTLSENCYWQMFRGCTGLKTASVLPATTLSKACYYWMFYDCTGLTSAPELPAETLAQSCYNGMFSGCTGLTSAPALPATTLEKYCYMEMFKGCTGLTSAPVLPAEILAENCYICMFQNCSNLNSVKCLATDISATNCTYYWLKGVATNGTFTKNSSMSSWGTGANGIPSDWTVNNQ